mmetsp:Transcript_26863/g.107519  ORF Transcript_26863/g.107519 Transcript_26863/m.107519 type:complete len:121 (+) Transcript_26863:789-1151(+)
MFLPYHHRAGAAIFLGVRLLSSSSSSSGARGSRRTNSHASGAAPSPRARRRRGRCRRVLSRRSRRDHAADAETENVEDPVLVVRSFHACALVRDFVAFLTSCPHHASVLPSLTLCLKSRD